ncbi:MAG: hypothetical protein GY827_04500 [Cytophagales bacterium]|nr:hypothetical protein [Cytophagales bacterium]
MERTLIKIKGNGGGPYILTYVANLVVPISLRGPCTHEMWYKETEDEVINMFNNLYGKDEVEVKKITTELSDLANHL